MGELTIGDLRGRRVAVWGTGAEGRAALAALRRADPEQPVVVIEERELAPETRRELDRWAPLEWRTGAAAARDLSDLDVLVKSPGVSLYRPEIAAARERGVAVTSVTRLWFADRPPGTTICVTGSKGKSTTVALAAHLLAAAGRRVETAGNLGRPLLELADVEPPEIWLLELSSYQVADLEAAPDVAVLTNLYPEHLDWHGSVERYFEDKVRFVARARRPVINAVDPATQERLERFDGVLAFNDPDGLHVRGDEIFRGPQPLLDAIRLPLAGRHNRQNLCAALAAMAAAGEDLEALAPALAPALGEFRPLRHRLTFLGERHGLLWVDDSLSTIPEAALAAVDAASRRPVTLLLGGYDRGVPFDALAAALVERAAAADGDAGTGAAGPGLVAVVTLPDSGPRIAAALSGARERAGAAGPQIASAGDLEEAVRLAREVTPAGGVVLLSPAAASYGHFRDHRERGRAFARAAGFGDEAPAA